MRAIRVTEHGGPGVLRLEDSPPLRPQAGQVLVAVRAAGVNPVDTYIRAGTQGYTAALPYTPGIDAAGIVEAAGSGVTAATTGDRVYCAGTITGSYAEQALCTAAQVHPLPDAITFAQGASIGVPYATAYRALFQRARAQPGETVLVHGASGGVGTAAVQLARAAGLTVLGTAGTEASSAMLREQGARHVLDHHDPDHLARARDLTGGRGLDVILEMLANVNLGNDLGALAPGGRVVVIGSRGSVEINPRDTMARDAAVLGMSLMNATEEELRRIHAALGAGLESGVCRPVVGREFPLAEAARAHEAVMTPPACGNIVLTV
jgi:NADPH2:quinone reductase